MQLSPEEFSTVTAAIHAAAAFPERWPEALSAVVNLVSAPGGKAGGESSRQGLLASLDRLRVSAFILNRTGSMHLLNACAQELLAADTCARVVGGRLSFTGPALDATLQTALRRATQSPGRSSLFPLRTGKNEVHEVNVSPFEAMREGASALPVPLALVIVAKPRPDAERIGRRVRRLFGLTEAEARVTAALTLGETVEQIAAAHGVRTSTVRAQVRSVFEKTGVHRQADLVRVALSGGPLFGPADR